MALNISVHNDPAIEVMHFTADDPLYWFLYPYFEETYGEVGQMVDLYGHAEFFAEELLAFFLILEDAEEDVRGRGDHWDVTIGFDGEDGSPISRPLHASDALQRIDALKQMLNHAYNVGRRLVCLGD